MFRLCLLVIVSSALMVSSQFAPVDVDSTMTTEQPVSDCSMPKDPGPCKAYFPRYFYNMDTKLCEEFVYGGCYGNTNNFANADDCKKACLP